jgi:hypothetical protein
MGSPRAPRVPDPSHVVQLPSPLQLYVHCATSVEYLAELNASIPGVERYAERALLLAEHRDVVCVPDEIEPAYLEYLTELGLGPSPENLLVASRFEGAGAEATTPLWQRILHQAEALGALSCAIRQHGSARIQPFIASQGQFALAAALERMAGVQVAVAGGDPAVVAYADSKHHIRARAIELGIPVAPGEIVDLDIAAGCRMKAESILCRAIQGQMQVTGRVIVRGTSGAAGSSTFSVERDAQIAELAERLVARGGNRIFLVESMVDTTVSPNVQMHISESGVVRCTGVTDQRWDRPLVHGGNLFPSRAHCMPDMIGWARDLAEWLRNSGFVGLAGFDFVEYTDDTGQPQAFLAEVNPRTNGATYPLRLIERLNVSQRDEGFPVIGAFTSGTIETEARTFAELRGVWDDRLFCPERGTGLVPFASGLLHYGKCGVVALSATREEADDLYLEAGAAMATS